MKSVHMSSIKNKALITLGLLLVTSSAIAIPITTNFSNFAGLGFGTGTNQAITQNGIELQVLQGKYEVTFFPEVNLIDGATRQIELHLASNLNFDFEGFSIRNLCCGGALTLTSSRGGSFNVTGFTAPTFNGSIWEDLDWVRFTYNGSTAKFTSFTLNDEPTVAVTVPEPSMFALFSLALIGGAILRNRMTHRHS